MEFVSEFFKQIFELNFPQKKKKKAFINFFKNRDVKNIYKYLINKS